MTDHAVSDDVAALIERLEGEEALDLEVKAARGGLPNTIWPTISAFANAGGGWLVLGVAERDGRLVVEGVTNPEIIAQQLADQMRNPQKISHPVSRGTDLRIEQIGSARVVVLRVPPAPRRVRPVYVDRNPFDGTYIRGHAGDHRCTRPEVERMMREAADLAADQVILDGYGWDDLDRTSFAGYRRRFQTLHPESPHNALDDPSFLAVIGGFRRDHETGRSGITVAGLLIFGTEAAIRSWRGRHLIDFRLVPGDPFERVQPTWTDRLPWEGNLLDAFDRIYKRLVDGLPIPFMLVDGIRVEMGPQHVAVREALVNLLVHADYRERDASLVIRSDRGFLLRNPGNSRVPYLDPAAGDRSDPRNPELVRMFRLIGLAEEAGSGVARIVQAWRSVGHEQPYFDLGAERYEFTVRLRYADFITDDDRAWLDAIGGPWQEGEQLALVTARHRGEIDNASLRGMTGQHPADVTRILGGLRDARLLQLIGTGRGARYQLDPSALAVDPTQSTADVRSHTTGLPPSTAGSDRPSTAGDDVPEAANSDGTVVDDPLWETLTEIARPVASVDYVEAFLRDDVIVQLCRVRPLAILELMWLLHRNKAYLRTVLKALVDAGRLAYLYPDRPRHPQQRYVAHDGTSDPDEPGKVA
jgi:ATP-dependent DNA helicase RecG